MGSEWDRENVQNCKNIIDYARVHRNVHINMDLIPHINAKNAYYARYEIMQHYANETYFMQIDSHIRFVQNWDTEHIKLIHDCDYREKSIITVYPCAFSIKNQTDGWEV